MIRCFKKLDYLIGALILTFCFISSTPNYAYGSGIEKLMKYASPSGTMSNANKAAIVKDQQGGYMTGGSLIMRGPQPKTLQPVLIQTPKFAFDACTGSADFRFGGLSYISAREFSSFFKNMGTAIGAYGLKLLVKETCPMCEDVMSYLETVARDINGMMIDQCSAAQKIAGGMFSAMTNASQQKCMMQSNMRTEAKDLYQSTDKCKSDPNRYGDAGDKDEFKSLLGDEFNLVWKAISKNSTEDSGLKELMMSVSGTIIGRKIDGRFVINSKPSLILTNNLLEQYIGVSNGDSKVKIYACDSKEKCLEPKEDEITLKREETLYGHVTKILQGLVPKVQKNKGTLSDDEDLLIMYSSIPLLKVIEMELINKARSEDMLIRMEEFIEVICYDVVTNYLQQMNTKTQASVEALEQVQIVDTGPINNFVKNMDKVNRFLRDRRFEAFERLQVITQVKQRLAMQEKVYQAEFAKMIKDIK